MGRINPLVAVGIPSWGKVSLNWARAYRSLAGPLGSVMAEIPVLNQPIAKARNQLMAEAIGINADFLFMLGDDVLAPGDAVIKLLHRMWDHPEVHLATGVYWTKQWPSAPYLWRGMQRGPYLDWRHGEWFSVDYSGCDALLLRLSPEIKALGPEWFSTTWYWEPEQGGPSALATEDFYFYTKARQAGLELWCDTSVQCVHEDRQTGQMFGLTMDMPQAGAPLSPLPEPLAGDPDGLVRVADIGAGDSSPFFGLPDRVRVIRFDGNEATKPDYRCDIRVLPVPDQSVDLVHSRHVIEHFGRDEVLRVLHEWTRILRVGGDLRLSCPNLLDAIRKILAMDAGEIEPHYYPWWQLYGEQRDHYDLHRNGFTVRRLRELLGLLGTLDDITVEEGDDGQNLYAKAIKVRHPAPFALTTEWDAIADREHIPVPGLQGRETLAPDATADGSTAAAVALTLDAVSTGRDNGHAAIDDVLLIVGTEG